MITWVRSVVFNRVNFRLVTFNFSETSALRTSGLLKHCVSFVKLLLEMAPSIFFKFGVIIINVYGELSPLFTFFLNGY